MAGANSFVLHAVTACFSIELNDIVAVPIGVGQPTYEGLEASGRDTQDQAGIPSISQSSAEGRHV